MPRKNDPTKLAPRVERFIREFLIDRNATQAAIRAGYSEKSAGAQAHKMLKNPHVSARVRKKVEKTLEKLEITAEKALEIAWQIANADARELVEYHVGACRYCHGLDHGYQRTQAEYDRDLAEFDSGQSKDDEWDSKGGIGFDPRAMPHPGCPECAGYGVGRPVIRDTRNLSPAAAALYAGVKTTKDGIELKMHSKLDALEKVAKTLGMYGDNDKGDGVLNIHINLS